MKKLIILLFSCSTAFAQLSSYPSLATFSGTDHVTGFVGAGGAGTTRKIPGSAILAYIQTALASGNVVIGTTTTGSIIFEGATADNSETTLGVVDPTADRTINLPNASGTVALASSQTGTLGTPSTSTPLSPTWVGETHVVYIGGAQTINLPAAAGYTGRALMLIFMGSYVATVDPNASEVIYRAGTAQTGGVSTTATGTLGQQAVFLSDGVSWITVGTTATLAVGS